MLPRAEHIWCTEVQVWGDRLAAGLLLGWRRNLVGDWEGYCIVVQLGISAQSAKPYVKQGWIRATAIRSVD